MQVEFTGEGICLPEIGLWLDPAADSPAAWISHGHSDHARGAHGTVFATRETLSIYELRTGHIADSRRRMEFSQPVEWHGARLTAYPAAHILGAAQLLVEYRGERLVYTGDIKLRSPLCGRATEALPCDRLIVESTFGLPSFHFLERAEARERILRFVRECFDDSLTPVFCGYPLGRGQEVAHVLCQAGVPLAIHRAVARFLPVYESAGYRFDGWQAYERGDWAGKALVVPPGFRNEIESNGRKVRAAYVSGWAALASARARAGAEELIPYSDHCDFDELLELVERTGARVIEVVHGYTEPFARILASRGYDARAPLAAARAETEDA